MNQNKIRDKGMRYHGFFCTFAIGLGRPNSSHKKELLI